MILTLLKVAGEAPAMDFDATAGMEWHGADHETGGCKAKLRKPKVAARLCSACMIFVVLLALFRGGRAGGRKRSAGAGPGAVFENHTVTIESANTVNECLSSPCLNGGVCVDLVESYGCDCLSGFSGPECQTRQNTHCPADNHCDAQHALCVADGGASSSSSGGSDRPHAPPPPLPPPSPSGCRDDESFIDGRSEPCAAYRGYGCDDTTYSGGTASATIKAACPLSCGICSVSLKSAVAAIYRLCMHASARHL